MPTRNSPGAASMPRSSSGVSGNSAAIASLVERRFLSCQRQSSDCARGAVVGSRPESGGAGEGAAAAEFGSTGREKVMAAEEWIRNEREKNGCADPVGGYCRAPAAEGAG